MTEFSILHFFFLQIKEIDSSKHLLNSGQTRLLERSLKNCVFNGANLNEADAAMHKDLSLKIRQSQAQFKHRLNYASKNFVLRLSDQMPMDEIPIHIKKLCSTNRENPEKGPWTIYPNDIVIEGFFRYCGNRQLRKTIYDGWYSRASYIGEKYQTNNSEVIKDLMRYR